MTRVMPVLSVVIVNWNVSELLRTCLLSVQEQMQLAPAAYELIVVDNASIDGSVEMLRREFPNVTLVANPENRGFARANNQALSLCRGAYIILLNPDTEVLDHALDGMVSYLQASPRVGALGCRLLNSDLSLQRWTAGAFPTLWNLVCHFLFLDRVLPRPLRPQPLFLDRDVRDDFDPEWVSGACMALRREALGDTIFNEAYFMYGEDLELCDRLQRHGWRVVYTPSATVLHHHGKSMRQQSGAIALAAVKGPRAFYAVRRGRSTLWLYDLAITVGFFIRWLAFRVASVPPGGQRYRERAASSRSHMVKALRVMAGQ